MQADAGQVLRARAAGSLDYGKHLIRQAYAAGCDPEAPRARCATIGAMACEQLEIAARAIVALHQKGLA